jgi:KaiC/GvpD/RAD55 family RecA-like ATPase
MTAADAWAHEAIGCEICGREACEDHIPTHSGVPNQTGLAFQSAADVIRTPRPIEIVEGIASSGSICVMVSESGTGKTFVSLDLAASVSSGIPWYGRDVEQGSVAYVLFEGDDIGIRLRAIRDKTGHRLDHLYVLRAQDPLSPRITRDGEERSLGEISLAAAVKALSEELKKANRPPIRIVVIDTVRASMAGSEDSSEHVSAYLRAVRRIMASVPGAGAVLTHHAGWQDGENQRKRERGSSAWRGNCDGTVYLEAGEYDADKGEAQLTLRTLKVRDGEKPPPLHLLRRRVELAERDRRGEPVTSCVIGRDTRSPNDREAERLASVRATECEVDLSVLQAMHDYPAATSIAKLRPYVGQRTELVADAVARILRSHLAVEGKRGQPYTITEAGFVRLNAAKS